MYYDDLKTLRKKINSGSEFYSKFDYENGLFSRPAISANEKYIYWCNYGCSANKNTLKNLAWILQTIFKMSPAKFMDNYIEL